MWNVSFSDDVKKVKDLSEALLNLSKIKSVDIPYFCVSKLEGIKCVLIDNLSEMVVIKEEE